MYYRRYILYRRVDIIKEENVSVYILEEDLVN